MRMLIIASSCLYRLMKKPLPKISWEKNQMLSKSKSQSKQI